MIHRGWGDKVFKKNSWVCLQPLLPFAVGMQMNVGKSYVQFSVSWVWGPIKHHSGDAELMNLHGIWRLEERTGWELKCGSYQCIDFKWSHELGRRYTWDHLRRQGKRQSGVQTSLLRSQQRKLKKNSWREETRKLEAWGSFSEKRGSSQGRNKLEWTKARQCCV